MKNDVATSYDALAEAYAERFHGELAYKPLDRALLDVLAAEVRPRGRVLDLGCGPGHVTRYLAEQGVDAVGIDVSPATVEVARRLSPGVPFEVGSMLELEAPDGSAAGIVAFYAIVNLAPDEVRRSFREMRRVLQPGAPALIAFHLGDERRHVEELFGIAVALDFHFFPASFVRQALEAAGLVVDVWTERRPYPQEHPSTRAYVVARREGS
jgi:SAM-dependent methyltransferase